MTTAYFGEIASDPQLKQKFFQEYIGFFGGLKLIKTWLHEMFDNNFLVAEDDPEIEKFRQMAEHGLVAPSSCPSCRV